MCGSSCLSIFTAMEGVWVACGKEMVCGAITGFHLGRPPNSAGVGPRGAVFGVARWLPLAAAPFMAPALWRGGGVGQILQHLIGIWGRKKADTQESGGRSFFAVAQK